LVDFDGDGRQDILSGSWPGEIYIFRRQEDGTFAVGKVLTDAKGKEINVGSAAAAFAADWDGDGDLDLLVGTISGPVYLIPNAGSRRSPAFGEPVKLEDAGRGLQISDSAPVAADWDGDGRLDLLVATGEGSVYFYRNVGTARDPRLDKPVKLIGESPGTARDDRTRNQGEWGQRAKICVTDWDGDGRPDILLGDYCGNFTAKPAQSAADRAAERAAIEQLPKLRGRWSSTFRTYREHLRAGTPRDDPGRHAKELESLRAELTRLRDAITRAQQIAKTYEPQQQCHGFVWLFLRRNSR
jgi:hypothetical protein